MNKLDGNQGNLFPTERRVEIGGRDQGSLFTEIASGVTSCCQKVSICFQHGWDTVKTKINHLRRTILTASEVQEETVRPASAVQDAKSMQDFESESLLMGAGHSQKVKAAFIKSDYGSKKCVDLASSTAESRIITKEKKPNEIPTVERAKPIVKKIDNIKAYTILKASDPQEVEDFARETRLILDTRVTTLIAEFLREKREGGTPNEKELYITMSVNEFIDRLIQRRPDHFNPWALPLPLTLQLYDQSSDDEGGPGCIIDQGDIVGLDDRWALPLSWEEYEISSYLGIAGQVHIGEASHKSLFAVANAKSAVFFGCVNAEHISNGCHNLAKNHCLIFEDSDRNSSEAWKNFFEVDSFYSYQEIDAKYLPIAETQQNNTPLSTEEIAFLDHYIPIQIQGKRVYLETAIYKKVMERRLSSFLREADHRAKSAGKKAHLRLKDLGKGVFGSDITSKKMWVIQCQCYAEIIRKYNLQNISELEFEDHHVTDNRQNHVQGEFRGYSEENINAIVALFSDLNGIKISFSHSLKSSAGLSELQTDNELLCVQYPWAFASAPGIVVQGLVQRKSDSYVRSFSNCTVSLMHNWEVNPSVSAAHMRCYDVSRQSQSHSPHEMKSPPSESDPSITQVSAAAGVKKKRKKKRGFESASRSSFRSSLQKSSESKVPPPSVEGWSGDDEQSGTNVKVAETAEDQPPEPSSQRLLH